LNILLLLAAGAVEGILVVAVAVVSVLAHYYHFLLVQTTQSRLVLAGQEALAAAQTKVLMAQTPCFRLLRRLVEAVVAAIPQRLEKQVDRAVVAARAGGLEQQALETLRPYLQVKVIAAAQAYYQQTDRAVAVAVAVTMVLQVQMPHQMWGVMAVLELQAVLVAQASLTQAGVAAVLMQTSQKERAAQVAAGMAEKARQAQPMQPQELRTRVVAAVVETITASMAQGQAARV
jgi:hypothetical protein